MVVFASEFILHIPPLKELDYLVRLLNHNDFKPPIAGPQIPKVFNVWDFEQI